MKTTNLRKKHIHINLRILENVSGLNCYKTDENPLVLYGTDLEDTSKF